MATQLIGVSNHTNSTLELINVIAGKPQTSDAVVIPPQTFVATGGKDGDFIRIPDATPFTKFLPADHIAVSGILVGNQPHTVYLAKVGNAENEVFYVIDNMSGTPIGLPNTTSFTSGVLDISINGTQPTVEVLQS